MWTQYRAELTWRHPNGWTVTPALEWRPEDVWVDDASTLKAPGYALASLAVSWERPGGLTLFLDARNLTDERFTPEFSAVTDARRAPTAAFYPGEGRSAFAGLSYAF